MIPRNPNEFKEAVFCLDALPCVLFLGKSDDSQWNGFAVPYFSKTEGERFCKINNASGCDGRVEYSAAEDAFLYFPEDLEPGQAPDVFGAVTVGDEKLYSIGGFSWVWHNATRDTIGALAALLTAGLAARKAAGDAVPDKAFDLAAHENHLRCLTDLPLAEAITKTIRTALGFEYVG